MRRPLHEQLYEQMRDRIRSGEWPEGERVPSEHSLIAEFGTSRGPIRQALATLRAEGAVDGGRGAPPRVRRLVPTQSFQSFVSFTDWARSIGRRPGQRVIEAARRPASETVADDLGVEPGAAIVEIVRLRLLDDEPAMLERSAFPFAVGKLLLAADLDTGSIYQTMQDHGCAPVRARHVFDAVPTDDLDAAALAVSVSTPLLRVRRTAWAEDGSLVEVADDRYLPTMASFAVENTSDARSALTRETGER
ncbi:GntR family transcriptional regulator [Microbacterium sp. J1-1]|uniref:GntR family transcriptional regulator n=1 Tax=Microbacterium sp. J1-1 TaxID=2992441 RepID=UPI00211501E8|nr:GntR family transcriptional regulator [Microbacterium sp. J1-1]UUE21129.1 GntR family transcriptional regulator [Microbacterium sp. J1-1]